MLQCLNTTWYKPDGLLGSAMMYLRGQLFHGSWQWRASLLPFDPQLRRLVKIENTQMVRFCRCVEKLLRLWLNTQRSCYCGSCVFSLVWARFTMWHQLSSLGKEYIFNIYNTLYIYTNRIILGGVWMMSNLSILSFTMSFFFPSWRLNEFRRSDLDVCQIFWSSTRISVFEWISPNDLWSVLDYGVSSCLPWHFQMLSISKKNDVIRQVEMNFPKYITRFTVAISCRKRDMYWCSMLLSAFMIGFGLTVQVISRWCMLWHQKTFIYKWVLYCSDNDDANARTFSDWDCRAYIFCVYTVDGNCFSDLVNGEAASCDVSPNCGIWRWWYSRERNNIVTSDGAVRRRIHFNIYIY